jgi:hypothetical protein
MSTQLSSKIPRGCRPISRPRALELSGVLDIRSDHSGTVVRVVIPVPCAKDKSTRLRQRKTQRKSAHAT